MKTARFPVDSDRINGKICARFKNRATCDERGCGRAAGS
jgi:hypothetical protein